MAAGDGHQHGYRMGRKEKPEGGHLFYKHDADTRNDRSAEHDLGTHTNPGRLDGSADAVISRGRGCSN